MLLMFSEPNNAQFALRSLTFLGSGSTQNTTAHIVKDIPVPVGSSVEIMAGNKIVLNVGDIIKIDCSVADKLSVTMSYMEIT